MDISEEPGRASTAPVRRTFAALATFLAVFAPSTVRAQPCAGISAAPSTSLTTVRVASGLLRPLFVSAPPNDNSRLFVVLQDGVIKLYKNGSSAPVTFLDISAITRSPADGGGGEQGLLGLAFDPNYATNGRFFVYHTDSTGELDIVAQYRRTTGNPDSADPLSRMSVLVVPHGMTAGHNGGMLAFGPADGHLYIATGDGGVLCDSRGLAQSGSSFLGKILRINVRTYPYSIPAGNPFAGPDGIKDEIWSSGLRNPWRFSFDRVTSDLYLADVGQSAREEINYRPGGGPGGENYGWPLYEGSLCPFPQCSSPTCSVPSHALPLMEYSHANGECAVTGGYVYRGCRMPSLHGTYFYADFCLPFIRTFQVVSGAVTNPIDRTAELAPEGGLSIELIDSFGEDARGEIYIVDHGGGGASGEVYKIVPVLQNLEVSGAGATPMKLDDRPGAWWSWEDLQLTSSHPIAAYRVYRSSGRGDGVFDCVHEDPGAGWFEGDPDVPARGVLYTYLVTAVNASGEETLPGSSSTGVPRNLSSVPCPP
jgi:glucose/arabinose dehydrogenase